MSDANTALPIPERLVTRNLSKTQWTSDAHLQAVTARRLLVSGLVPASPFQATDPSYRGAPRCQASDPKNWETALTPPQMGTGARKEETGTGVSPSFARRVSLVRSW